MSKGKGKRRLPAEESSTEEGAAAPSPSGRGSNPRPRWPLALLLFSTAALIVVLVVKSGGDDNNAPPSFSTGYVATVHGVHGHITKISAKRFEGALQKQLQERQETEPQPGEASYEDLQASVLGELLQEIWLQEEAQKLGVSVTGEEVAAEIARAKAKSYPTEASYQKYLQESGLTAQEVSDRVRRGLLGEKVQAKMIGTVPQSEKEGVSSQLGGESRER